MLHLTAARATLANLNTRTEKLGKDKHRPAADLKFQANVPNTVLDLISPGLLNSLYRRSDEKGHQGDLTAPDPTYLTTPRHRAKPWAAAEDWPGYFASIAAGEYDRKQIDLDKVTLKSIVAEPMNGGTVALSFTLSGYPTGEDVGVLYELLGNEIDLSIQPPALGDLERLRAEAKAKAAPEGSESGSGDGSDEEEEGAPAPAQAAGRAFPDAVDGRGAKPARGRKARADLN